MKAPTDTITATILDFVARELLHEGDELDEHTPLLAWGVITSLSMASLLTFIDAEFGVRVPNDGITVENFEDVAAIAAMVRGRKASDDTQETASIHALLGGGVVSEWHELDDGLRVHCLAVEGDGARPPWVLLPGLGEPAGSWAGVLRAIAGDRAGLAVDPVGFGVSTGADELHYLEHVDVLTQLLARRHPEQPVVLVGSSAGALVALEYARRHPDRVAALVIVGFGVISKPAAWLAELGQVWTNAEEFLARTYFAPPRADDGLQARLEQLASSSAFRRFLRAEELGSESFAGLSVPTLFIGGSDDRIVGMPAIHAALERVPGAELIELARCGHLPGTERPDETAFSIAGFLRERGLE